MEPALTPVMQWSGMPWRSNARSTPAWAMPRAKPPPSANPIRGGTIDKGPWGIRVLLKVSEQFPRQHRMPPHRLLRERPDMEERGSRTLVALRDDYCVRRLSV